MLLITGQGPFPKPLMTQPPGPRSAAWAGQFANAARAGGWRVEMAWYEITAGGDLSVIPQTQATSVNATVTNAIIAASKAAAKRPASNNATATNATTSETNATASAATNATPPGKPTPPPKTNGVTNTAKPDIPL